MLDLQSNWITSECRAKYLHGSAATVTRLQLKYGFCKSRGESVVSFRLVDRIYTAFGRS